MLNVSAVTDAYYILLFRVVFQIDIFGVEKVFYCIYNKDINLHPRGKLTLIQKQLRKIKRVFIEIWDPDYKKVTRKEKNVLDNADQEMDKGHYYLDNEVW